MGGVASGEAARPRPWGVGPGYPRRKGAGPRGRVLGGGGCSYLCALASRTPGAAEVGGGALLPLGLRRFHAGERPQPTPRERISPLPSSSSPAQFEEESLLVRLGKQPLLVWMCLCGARVSSPLAFAVPCALGDEDGGRCPFCREGVEFALRSIGFLGGGSRVDCAPTSSPGVRAKAPLGLGANSAPLGERL